MAHGTALEAEVGTGTITGLLANKLVVARNACASADGTVAGVGGAVARNCLLGY